MLAAMRSGSALPRRLLVSRIRAVVGTVGGHDPGLVRLVVVSGTRAPRRAVRGAATGELGEDARAQRSMDGGDGRGRRRARERRGRRATARRGGGLAEACLEQGALGGEAPRRPSGGGARRRREAQVRALLRLIGHHREEGRAEQARTARPRAHAGRGEQEIRRRRDLDEGRVVGPPAPAARRNPRRRRAPAKPSAASAPSMAAATRGSVKCGLRYTAASRARGPTPRAARTSAGARRGAAITGGSRKVAPQRRIALPRERHRAACARRARGTGRASPARGRRSRGRGSRARGRRSCPRSRARGSPRTRGPPGTAARHFETLPGAGAGGSR